MGNGVQAFCRNKILIIDENQFSSFVIKERIKI